MIGISTLAYQLLSVVWITSQRQRIHDNTCSRTQWDNRYDFIVVGAGTAGAIVANKLSKNNSVGVLLLEAGGPQSALYNDIPGMWSLNTMNVNEWLYHNKPHQNYGQQYAGGRVPDYKGKTLGGCSAHNGMQFNRGNRRGYDEWANTYGAVGWSYNDVLPVFKEWENNTNEYMVGLNPGYHGTRGPIQISSQQINNTLSNSFKNALNEFGFMDTDINGPNQAGVMIAQQFITSRRIKAGTGNTFIDPNPYPDNLHIVCRALVSKILFNGLTAIGVEFIMHDISYKVYANKEVIVSGGPINSPQLLMLSGLGPKQHLQSLEIPVVLDLPVGNNYQNHPQVIINSPIKPEYIHLSPNPQITTEQLGEFYYNQSGMLTRADTCTLYHSTRTNRDNQWPNSLIIFVPLNSTLISYLTMVRVQSMGTIRLQSTSPYDHPIIDPNWLSDPHDYQALFDETAFVFFLLQHSAINEYIVMSDVFTPIGCPVCPGKYAYDCVEGLQCYIRYYTTSGLHPGGSCRMGSIDRPDVVVDPLLKVKGVEGLRVCDSSVFPIVPNANTESASLLVGYKCVKYIKNQYNLN